MRLRGWLLVCGISLVMGPFPVDAQRRGDAPAGQASPQMVAPEGRLERSRFPTARQTDVLLEVTKPGRFSIRAESASGTALQLVDMLTGPGPLVGVEGVRDGRVDVLLDVGTYKLRVFGAEAAQGDVRLALSPFREAAASVPAPVETVLTAELEDLQQRSFWLEIDRPRRVRIEAAGRSLADLRVWRDGYDLISGEPATRQVEPVRGHELLSVLHTPVLQPGKYLITAYGGPAQPWADGSREQPFHLRVDASAAFADAWVNGTIGPFGSEVYEVPRALRQVQLTLPASMPVTMRETVDGRSAAEGALTTASRDPQITLPMRQMPTAQNNASHFVEISGMQGQQFQLRGFVGTQSRRLATAGSHVVTAEARGFGGDEVPPTFLLFREELHNGKREQILAASSAPQVGGGQAWRARFNMRGPTSILFEVKGGGPISIRTENPNLAGSIRNLMGGTGSPTDLTDGWYELRLNPTAEQVGVVDLTIGAPGVIPDEPSPRLPADPTLYFGVQTITQEQALILYSNTAVSAAGSLLTRTAEAKLEGNPLTITQQPGQDLLLPATVPGFGTVMVRDITTGERVMPVDLRVEAATPLTYSSRNPDANAPRHAQVAVPAPAQARTVAISWVTPKPGPSIPQMTMQPQPATALVANKPFYFNMERNAQRSFTMTVPEGGLYRVETLGRQRAHGTLGTSFIPQIASDQAGGVGQNMLLQTYLRAGRYQVQVGTQGSEGRMGIVARPAPLLQGATLRAGGSVRASMRAGGGVVFPIEITERADYFTLDLRGLDRSFMARVEDEGGWPLLPVGEVIRQNLPLTPGKYRLVVMPQNTDARVVARLTRAATPVVLEGHGPHALPFGETQRFLWREPEDRTAERVPDMWDFTLHGDSRVTIGLSDGMAGELVKISSDGASRASLGMIARSGERMLSAGHYRIEARAIGRNDRLDYTLTIGSRELQPEMARRVRLPVQLPFAVAEDRVVSLTSFGSVGMRAVLRRADGTVVGRFGDRTDDWNIGISQYLAAGSYVLDLQPPLAVTRRMNSTARNTSEESDEGEGNDTDADADASERGEGFTTESGEVVDQQGTEVKLSLFEVHPAYVAPLTGAATLTGGGVHRLTVPVPRDDQLMLASASAGAEIILALERRDEDGRWQHIALDQGLSPVVAMPIAGSDRPDSESPWRISVWTVDGGAEPIRFVTRLLNNAAQEPARASLQLVDRDALPGLQVASVSVPRASLLQMGNTEDLLTGSVPGRPLTPVDGRIVVPQSSRVWVVGRNRVNPQLGLQLTQNLDSTTQLSLAHGEIATLPMMPAQAGFVQLWRAESATAQPGVNAGLNMGFAGNGVSGSAVVLAGSRNLYVWNAGDHEAMRVRLYPQSLRLLPTRTTQAQFMEMIPPGTAVPVALPAGGKRLQVDLAPGTAAIAGWTHEEDAQTLWSGSLSGSYSLEGGWGEILLINTSTTPQPVSYQTAPLGGAAMVLRADRPLKQFFGAAGTVVVPVDSRPGQRLMIAGDARGEFLTRDGRILRGNQIDVNRPGYLTLRHGIGPVAIWLEGEGATPWPATTNAQLVRLPQYVTLVGDAMALSLSPPTPVLLHIRSSAPLVAALSRDENNASPTLFPAGVEYHRYLPAGTSLLRLMSAQNGPLSGSLELTSTPVIPVQEGLGSPVVVAPGGSAVFGFDITKAGTIGVGIRAEPDRTSVRVLDENGAEVGRGTAQLLRLEPGRYLIEAQTPPDAGTTVMRPAVVGIEPRPNGPPEDVVRMYLELAGRSPVRAPAR